MFGTLKSEPGVAFTEANFKTVKKIMKENDRIEPHTHKGFDVIFIVVKGLMQITLNGEESHKVSPGEVLYFAEDVSIEGTALADTEIFVTLVHKD